MKVKASDALGIKKNMTIDDIAKVTNSASSIVLSQIPAIIAAIEVVHTLEQTLQAAITAYNTAVIALNAAKMALGIGDIPGTPVALAAKAKNEAIDTLITTFENTYIEI